jgi:hypothetical protein
VPTVKKAQQRVKSHIFISFRERIISRKLKFDSDSRGALLGSRAWMKAFSFSVSHFAVGGTEHGVSLNAPKIEWLGA